MKNNFIRLFIISILIYLINAQNIFILEKAEEKASSNKNIRHQGLPPQIKTDIPSSIEQHSKDQLQEMLPRQAL